MNGLIKVLAGIAAALIGAKVIDEVTKNTNPKTPSKLSGGTGGDIGNHDTGSKKR